MIGLSKAKAEVILDELRVLNPKGTFTFTEGEFSLIKDVDRFSEEIKEAEEQVDILCMSPGYISFAGTDGKPLTTTIPNTKHLTYDRNNRGDRYLHVSPIL
jgi:hypothetical protein